MFPLAERLRTKSPQSLLSTLAQRVAKMRFSQTSVHRVPLQHNEKDNWENGTVQNSELWRARQRPARRGCFPRKFAKCHNDGNKDSYKERIQHPRTTAPSEQIRITLYGESIRGALIQGHTLSKITYSFADEFSILAASVLPRLEASSRKIEKSTV